MPRVLATDTHVTSVARGQIERVDTGAGLEKKLVAGDPEYLAEGAAVDRHIAKGLLFNVEYHEFGVLYIGK